MSLPVSVGAMHDSAAAILERRFRRSMDVPTTFFEAHADRIASACQAMAARFERGGRLLVASTGAEASDARHIAVEFVHPVLVGKRALPALALEQDTAQAIALVGAPADIVLVLGWRGLTGDMQRLLASARSAGMLTLALTGGPVHPRAGHPTPVPDVAEFLFHVASDDALAVQETHETLYHVLWELVHLFFDRSGNA
jgi:D-sedoheptulose 7-phosphate isomerase